MSKEKSRKRGETAAEQTRNSAFKRALLAESRLKRYRTIARDFLATLEPEVLSLLKHQGLVTDEDMAYVYELEQDKGTEKAEGQLELTAPDGGS